MAVSAYLKKLVSCAAAGALLVCAAGSPAAGMAPEDERLLATARLWRDVKLYHLAVARGEVDWDAALVASLPAIREAKTPEQFHAAIDRLLQPLHDPLTGQPPLRSAPPVALDPSQPAVEWLPGDIALLHAHDDASLPKLRAQAEAIKLRARGAIIDLRPSAAGFGWQGRDELASLFIDKPLTLPALRYLTHSGYVPVRGGTSGGYQSSLTSDLPAQLLPAPGARAVPVVFVVDGRYPVPPSALALQHAGKAWIASAGTLAPPVRHVTLDGYYTLRFSAGEHAFDDGSVGAVADVQIADDARSAPGSAAVTAALALLHDAPQAKKSPAPQAVALRQAERPYAEMSFPDLSWRELAVIKLWAVMDAFFPYKALMDRPWDEALPLFFKQMETVHNAQEYALAIAEMATWLQDSHVGTYGRELTRYYGVAAPGVRLEKAEGKIVVAEVASPDLPGRSDVKVGDVLVSVDGEDAQQRLRRVETYIPASTQQGRDNVGLFYMTRGAAGSTAQFRLVRADGSLHDIALERKTTWTMPPKTSPVFRLLDGNIGYADLTRLQPRDVGPMFAALKDTRALVLDMRGYPNGVMSALAQAVNVRGMGTAAKFSRPLRRAQSHGEEHFQFDQTLPPPPAQPYRGKLVMLINEHAISQSEHTALFLEAAAPVTFVGSQTTGADGDVTNTVLPGDIQVSFSGHEVRHADGRQLQRIGITPDIPVVPTIAGIREGRDEVLERALAFIKDGR